MNAVLQTTDRLLVSLTDDEFLGISNALNEVCHGVHIDDSEFQTRLGVSRRFLSELLRQLRVGVGHDQLQESPRVEAWADGASVQTICISAYGDPADLSTAEARIFLRQLGEAIDKAEGN